MKGFKVMRVDNNDNAYTRNQCSLVIRVDGEEIEIPVTFGMTADEIRMLYPFLLPMLNDNILNPAVQFVKANEQGLLSDLTDEEYRNELIRVTEQSKYWYEKPSAGLLDIAVRFAVDIKMKGIEDLDFIFNRSASYDPMKIKPLTEMEANTIMQKLRIDGTQNDLDAFANLGSEIMAQDSTPEEIEQHEEVREQKADFKEHPFSNEAGTDATSDSDNVSFAGKASAIDTADVFKNIRQVLKQSIFAKHGVDQELYDHSLEWYGHNMDVYTDVCDRAMRQLEDEKKSRSSIYSDTGYDTVSHYDEDEERNRRLEADIANSGFSSGNYDDDEDDDLFGQSQFDEGEPPEEDNDDLDFSDFNDTDGEND